MPSTRRKPEAPGERLRAFARNLGLPVMGESSVKLVQGAAQADRYLLSVPAQLTQDQRRALWELVSESGLTAKGFAYVAASLVQDAPTNLHFGFEATADAEVLKLYVEFSLARWDAMKRAGSPLLVHRAVKWVPGQPDSIVTSRYVAYPKLTVSETSERILMLLGDNPAGSLALSLFNRAAGRVAAMERLFLEVQEKDTPRQSFDLKLYDAGFTTADIPIASLAAFFGIENLRIPTAALGHIAGGLGRDARPFLTLYYGGGRV